MTRQRHGNTKKENSVGVSQVRINLKGFAAAHLLTRLLELNPTCISMGQCQYPTFSKILSSTLATEYN